MELVRRESVKSAKAAIMSRNMSHNLGSHVMFYIKQKLESVEKIFKDGALRNLVESPTIEDFSKRLNNQLLWRSTYLLLLKSDMSSSWTILGGN